MKKVIAWVSLIIIAVLISILLFIQGREHKVFIENKTSGDIQALKLVNYVVDGQKEIKVKKNKKKAAKVKGPKHEIIVTYEKDGETVEIIKTFELKGINEGNINLPVLISGAENWFEQYKVEAE